jgi:hypothetical protein
MAITSPADGARAVSWAVESPTRELYSVGCVQSTLVVPVILLLLLAADKLFQNVSFAVVVRMVLVLFVRRFVCMATCLSLAARR